MLKIVFGERFSDSCAADHYSVRVTLKTVEFQIQEYRTPNDIDIDTDRAHALAHPLQT